MALRDIFKFREQPERETSKPFLEHLEDLRWTIVKMAITLVAAMIVCFAFRSTLVRSTAGAVAGRRFTNRNAQSSRHHRFYRDFVSSGVLRRHRYLLSAAALFHGGVCAAGADRRRKTLLVSGYLSELRALPSRCDRLLFLVVAEDDSFFFRDTESLGWAPTWTVQQYYSFVTRFTTRFRVGFRIASGSAGPGSIWIDYLQVHGAHTTLRCRADIYSGDDHHADTRHSDLGRDGAPMCLLYESCIWIAWANGAPQLQVDHQLVAWIILFTSFSSERLRLFSARQSGRF